MQNEEQMQFRSSQNLHNTRFRFNSHATISHMHKLNSKSVKSSQQGIFTHSRCILKAW